MKFKLAILILQIFELFAQLTLFIFKKIQFVIRKLFFATFTPRFQKTHQKIEVILYNLTW